MRSLSRSHSSARRSRSRSRSRSRGGKRSSVLDEWLSTSGIADAIRDGLKSLFTNPQLPDNPFHYLAAQLGAYVDQAPLWAEHDAAIVAALDSHGGGLELADASRLCRLAGESSVVGLPHVLRTVSKEGARVVQSVLADSLPDSFFPGPTPFSSRDGGYTVQALSSVQGATVPWAPQWLEFPELIVRCDVVVRGPRLDGALALLAQLLASDLAELEALPVNFAAGLQLVEPLALQHLKPAAGGSKPLGAARAVAAPAARTSSLQPGLWSLADIRARPQEFAETLSREVLAGKQVQLGAVALLEAPVDAAHLQEYTARFEVCRKTYCFHFSQTAPAAAASPGPPPALAALSGRGARGGKGKAPGGGAAGGGPSSSSSSSSSSRVTHFGSQPYEALFEGYFLDMPAAKHYLALFTGERGGSGGLVGPYAAGALAANSNQLANLTEADMLRGSSLEGFRRLLLLVLLQDGGPLQPGPLTASSGLLSLEDLLLGRPTTTQGAMLLSCSVNLVRILNSGAACIQGIVRELEALLLVLEQWPRRRQACIAAAEAAAAGGEPGSEPGRGDDAQEHAAATLAWLAEHTMEARLLEQVLSLVPRIRAAAGGGVFAGISLVVGRLLSELPERVPAAAEACLAALHAARQPMESLRSLLAVAALSLADALLDRCRDVMWALQRFGIRTVDSVSSRAALAADEALLPPEWVLDVGAVTDTRVRSGAVAERVATEGVMLQYAVDTQLDACLAAVCAALTAPPLQPNPYPRLLHMLRARAARLDLWRESADEVREQLLNQLVLLSSPPGFIYAASPSSAAGSSRGRGSGRQRRSLLRALGAGSDSGEDDGPAVYGCYAAVTLCDVRALQALAASLGSLLSPRTWSSGAYSADVLPALTGDAALSGALALSSGDVLQPSAGAEPAAGCALGGVSATRSPYEHPRFFTVELEEHHQLEGPSLPVAARLFAESVLDHALELHRSTQHIVAQLAVGGGATFSLVQLLQPDGREAVVAALVGVLRAAAAARPATCCDDRVASLLLLVAVKEGLYIKLLKHMCFAHRSQRLSHDTASTASAAVACSQAASPSAVLPCSSSGAPEEWQRCCSSAAAAGRQQLQAEQEALEPHWGTGVYRRVFLTEASALAWAAWNGLRGDPAQPFHHQHLVQQLQQQARELEARGSLLDAQKLLLTAATAAQDVPAMCDLSHALHSTAQELRCLQEMHSALALLLAPDLAAAGRAKLDSERLRRTFLLYCSRLRAALSSPASCFFSGFAGAAPGAVSALREAVLGGSELVLRDAAAGAFAQLDLWTAALEASVAAAVHDCLEVLP